MVFLPPFCASSPHPRAAHLVAYCGKIEEELTGIVEDIQSLLKDHLLPHAQSAEAKVEYMKMQGDYHRYHSEIAVDAARDAVVLAAKNAYQAAYDLSMELKPDNATRLGLMLNYSVFYYEIMNEYDQAIAMAKAASDEAGDVDDENAISILTVGHIIAPVVTY